MAAVAVAQDSTYSQSGDSEGGLWWAFRPVREVAVPKTRTTGWTRGPVDRFLLAAMEEVGLQPVQASDPRSLIRRLHYDLTGLPPTPEVVERFASDPSDAAYENLVDSLIASRQFGERWGRHWLDVARFAESSGGGRSLMFKNAWRFRDYVIDSYNADRPFAQFLREQLAGDLLQFESDDQHNRQVIATGFLELGPTNYEQQDKQLLRMDVIDEQIDTVGRVFMGMTLGCARCHDHKFDPVPIEDYYALAGIFGSTELLTRGNVSGYVERELRGPGLRAYHVHQKRQKSVQQQLKLLRKAKAPSKRAFQQDALRGIVLDDVDAKRVGKWVSSTHVAGYLGRGYIHDDNKSKGKKSVRFVPDIPNDGEYEIRLIFTSGPSRATNVPVEVTHAGGNQQVSVSQRSVGSAGGEIAPVGQFHFEKGRLGAVTVKTSSTNGHVIVDGLQLIPIGEAKEKALRAPADKRAALAAQRRDRQTALEAELARLKKAAPPAPPVAMAVRDVAKPKDGHVHSRGLPRTLGAVVPRGFLTVCGDARPSIPPTESGRRELAEWLADPKHPLVARVYVNRVWHHLFGTGLVRTTDNFGKMGERPSHPELLDWLAANFVRRGWSSKKLIRELVVSAAYRLRTAANHAPDPDNRLLSHANRRRLDAESLRDTILVVSGQLDPKMGGSTIRKFSTYDYGYAFESNRRSVYVPRFRGTRLEMFNVFDAADPNLVTGRRINSHVSTQALYLMNSPWVMRHADFAARQLLVEADQDVNQLLDRAYLRTIGRLPDVEERRLAREFLARFSSDNQTKAWGQLFHTLFACLDFRYLG
ncbi:MAG: DUF1553 domain-containing protein [Planctomycetota bacterium]|nr:DUF1553 domain-containing protein [Planctomycetota bacterium]